jgi:hypothetical protein
VTVKYYSGTTSTPAPFTDTLLATSIVDAISGTNSTLFVIQPVSGLYYYYTVTVGVYNIYISTSTQMPAPVATNVAMGAIGNPQGYLSASWNVVPPSQVTLQFYSNNTSSVSSGSPATIGSAITTSATSYTLTATLTPNTYYYVTVTPTGGAAAKPPLGIQMPASTASAVALGSLSDASTTLSANWSLGGTSTQVNATYYSTNSSTVPGTGGTSVATTSNIAAGVFTDTNAFSPIQGTYYYVGVVPTSGGSEVRSAVAIQMPYPTVTGATMGPLNSLSGALTCTWDLSSPSSVSVSYFVVGTNAVTGGTLVGSAQSVGSGTTANTYVQTLTAGQYYYAVITPVGGTGVAVGAAVQMPYPVVSGVTVGPLNNTSAASICSI